MAKKTTKLIGLSFSNFKDLVKSGDEFHLQTARLIPFYKPGDEMALTSIFMSSLRLIKEFRKNMLKEMEDVHEKLETKEIKSFSIVRVKYLGSKFEKQSKFVDIIEEMLVLYYQTVVQYLKKWEKPVPKIATKDTDIETI